MLTKRIIPCLDVKNGRTVKGVQFLELRDAGDPIALAKRYVQEGADELAFLDISATNEERSTFLPLVERVAQEIDIPFTVGGGIRSIEDASRLLEAGADKISLNSAAVQRPELITEIAQELGSQAVVVAIDMGRRGDEWKVLTHGGSRETDCNAPQWAHEAQERGAGEILLTSIESDGSQNGFSIEPTHLIATSLSIPVIASGGAGTMEDFLHVFTSGAADAALAASVFHFGAIRIQDLKAFLSQKGVTVRYES